MSYVLVEFLLDKTQPVVSSDDVRDFSGVVEDDKVYQVYWAGDARTKGSFYDAKVLYMADENSKVYKDYRIILPRLPTGMLVSNSLFLHADITGRPYKPTDFKEALFSIIEREDLIALGPYQMSHVWMAVFANGAAKCKIKACEELVIKQKRINNLKLLTSDKEGGFVVLPQELYWERAENAVLKNFKQVKPGSLNKVKSNSCGTYKQSSSSLPLGPLLLEKPLEQLADELSSSSSSIKAGGTGGTSRAAITCSSEARCPARKEVTSVRRGLARLASGQICRNRRSDSSEFSRIRIEIWSGS
ncbi:uncharacterized protein ISCGN_017933 [Ixodes scapularis]